MHKRSIFILLLLLLFWPHGALAGEAGVVINRFQISGAGGANDEFVELINTSSAEVDISGWKLAKKSASATATATYLRTLIPAGTIIKPGSTLIIAHPDYCCASDIPYQSSGTSVPSGVAVDNTILLKNGSEVIDKVGFGKASDYEGSPIPKSPATGEIYSRRERGKDTDNNGQDFYLSYAPPKEEPEKPTEESDNEAIGSPTTPGAKIIVSEFMINPEGSDTEGEWIEIYNAGAEANITGYSITDKLGSPKKYVFPKGTIIKKGQYLAFYSGKTPISLNNDGDAVEILNPEGVVISSSENSGKGPEGASFALYENKWVWTSKPTPGRANIIEPTDKDSDSTKSKTGEVLALVDENDLPSEEAINESRAANKNDQLLGYGLIVIAILGGISYTLYIYKEKLREFYYNNIRKGNNPSGSKIRQRLKGRGDLSPRR